MSIAGYKVFNKKGELVDEIVGLVKRDVLNKYRKAGLIIKKMMMPKSKNY